MEKKKSKSLCKKFFRQFDLFGTFITFTIKGENDYKSFLGGITTLLLIIIMGVYVCYMSYRFIARKEFDFIFSNKIIDDPFLNLTEINFNMAFGIQFASNHQVVDPSIFEFFDFELYMKISYMKNHNKILSIGYHQCSPNDYYDFNSISKDSERQKMNLTKMQQIFVLHGLGYMRCPVKPENDDTLQPQYKFINNYFLQGTYVDLNFRYLNIDVKIKDKIRKDKDKYEYFKKYIKENPLEVILLYIDTGINYEEKFNTLPNYVGFMIKDIDLNFTKTTDIFVSNVEFFNDLNIFISHGTTTKDAMFDYMIDSFKNVDRESDVENNFPLVSLRVKASPKIIQLSRVYQKFPSFIADLTGILEEILVLATLMINFFEKKIMDKKLINRILTYKQGIFFQTDDFIKEKPIVKIKIKDDKESIYSSNSNTKYKISLFRNKLSNNNSSSIEIYSCKGDKEEFNDNKIYAYEYTIKKYNNQKSKFNNENNFDLKSSDRDLIKKQQKNETFMKIEKEKESNYLKNKLNNIKTIEEEKTNEKKNKKHSKIINLIKEHNFNKITIWTLIFSKVCLCTKERKNKNKIVKKLEFKVHHYLDIYNYIEKMQEIDLIKYCVFDEKQMKAFNNLFNPILNEYYRQKNNSEVYKCDIKKHELNDLFKNPEKLEKYLKKNGINL